MIWTLKNALSKNTWIGEKNQCTTAEHIFRATKASQVMEEKKKNQTTLSKKEKAKQINQPFPAQNGKLKEIREMKTKLD